MPSLKAYSFRFISSGRIVGQSYLRGARAGLGYPLQGIITAVALFVIEA